MRDTPLAARLARCRSSAKLCAVGVLIVTVAVAFGPVVNAAAATFAGKTSQRRAVRVEVSRAGKLRSLIIDLSARCSDGKRRTFTLGFQSPFKHPQSRSGVVSDAYDIVGQDAATGVRFRQRAKFSAQVTHRWISGNAQGTETLLATGVVCKSPQVTFRLHL
jgi:hypothetical protein